VRGVYVKERVGVNNNKQNMWMNSYFTSTNSFLIISTDNHFVYTYKFVKRKTFSLIILKR
jgi:hypothetical protein